MHDFMRAAVRCDERYRGGASAASGTSGIRLGHGEGRHRTHPASCPGNSRFHGCVKRLLLSGVHCALAGEEGLDGAVEAPRCLYGRSQETALRGVHAANTTHLRRVVSKNRNMFGLLSCAGCNRLTRIACAGGEGVAHGPAMGAQHPDGPRRCGDRSPCPRLWCGRERGYPLPNRPGPRRGLFFLYSR